MTFVSLFAGIGGFDLGMERAGLTPVGMCEIDPHAQAVLTRHWPNVPLHDDVTTLTVDTFGPADVITFGSPCQDLSVAGKRAGLDGERSGLFLEAVRYIREMLEETNGRSPRFAVWENVPGAFSSNNGHDFAAVLESLVGGEVRRPADGWANAGVAFGPLGSVEWRVLDSQHFGVAQRRRRVFVVYRPGGIRAGEVLLEPAGVPGDSPPRREAGERVAPTLEGRAGRSGATNFHTSGGLVESALGISQEYDAEEELVGTLKRGSPSGGGIQPMAAVPVAFKMRGGKEGGGKGYLGSEDKALTISTVQEQYLAEPLAFENHGYAQWRKGVGTVRAEGGDAGGGSETVLAYVASDYSTGAYEPADKAEALTTSADRTRAAPIAFALRGREDGATPEVSGDRTNALRGAGGGSSRDYVAYGVVSKGNGEAFLTPEQHMSLTSGGGQAGQGYPAVMAPVAFAQNQRDEVRDLGKLAGALQAEPGMKQQTFLAQPLQPTHGEAEPAHAGRANDRVGVLPDAPEGGDASGSGRPTYAVRRLTPRSFRECERLQAFPDDHTRYCPDGTEIADTHRYRMLGNAVTVSVAHWIAQRIKAVAA